MNSSTPAPSGAGSTPNGGVESTFVGALRALAALLETHPDLPEPFVSTSWPGLDVHWMLWVDHNDEDGLALQKSQAAQIVKTIGGRWDKAPVSYDPDRFEFTQTRDRLELRVSVSRPAVCERVVVGTETVTIPATAAVEAQPERVEEREIVEWRCEPLLADTDSSAVAS